MKRNFAAKLRALVFDGPKRSRRIKSAARGFSTIAASARGGRAHPVQMSQLPSFANSTSNAYGMAERLHRYQDFCLAGDVHVALPTSAEFVRIDALVERFQNGESFTVFALVDGRIRVKRVTGARCTGTKRTLTVALESGASVRCTADHRFMLEDERYVEAGQLVPGAALRGPHGAVKVACVSDSGLDELVYDIEVAGAGNFLLTDVHPARGVVPTVFVHNCEMETMPELAAALDIYADESVSSDEKGRVLTVYSANAKIKETLEDLFFNVMNVEFNLRGWTRNVCKYGDAFLWLSIVADRGVDRVFPIPINEMEREEGYDPSDPLAYRFKWLTSARHYEPWEIAHFRLLGNDQFLPYGQSVIESSRRIWRQLVLMEDAMLTYRIVRAPERRVFYIDVGNTPPDEVPLLIEESKKNIRSNQVVDKTTGRSDLRYNPLCNSLRTLIKLQDGRTISLKQLIAEREAGRDDHWVYSIDLENKRLAPGRVVWAGVTMKDARLCRVHLDDGTWRDCTPDHRFMLRDGSYRAASDLLPGTSLMPLYVKLTDKTDGHKIVGYEKAYDPFTQQYVLTHRANVIATQGFDSILGRVVHHADFDKRNNAPWNLKTMTWREHHALHGSLCVAYNKSDRGRANSARKMSETWKRGAISSSLMSELWRRPEIRLKRVEGLTRRFDDECMAYVRETLQALGASTTERQLIDSLNADPCFAAKLQKLNCDFRNGNVCGFTRSSWQSTMKRFGYVRPMTDLKRELFEPLNHRVVRVEMLAGSEDVGDLTVEHYHNFAAGHSPSSESEADPGSYVFLHNSIEEDYWIPVRGGDTGTKIDTLQGGQNQAAIEDIQYLQKKLFAALKIPKAYLGFEEGLASKATLSQEDIRFSRSIAVIQKTLVAELNKIAMVHLFVRGFPEEALQDFYLTLANPSTVAQQQKLELLRARAEIAGTFPEGFVDREWIRSEVLDLEEAHIFQIDDRRVREKRVDAAVEAAGAGAPEGDPGSSGGGGGGGGGSLFGDAPDAPAGDSSALDASPDATPSDDAAPASDAGDDEDLDLDVTAADDDEEDLEAGAMLLTSGDDRAQPKPGDQLDRALYNRSRHRTHGVRKLVTPDHSAMLTRTAKADPFDSHWLTQRAKPAKLDESCLRTSVSPDVVDMLKRARAAAQAARA